MEPVSVIVGTAYENGVFTLGFADQDGDGALLLSLSDTVEEQDALLGMDSYCVSTDQGLSFYGGIESATWNGRELELRVTLEAADRLGVPSELRLQFDDEVAIEMARAGLRRVGIATRST